MQVFKKFLCPLAWRRGWELWDIRQVETAGENPVGILYELTGHHVLKSPFTSRDILWKASVCTLPRHLDQAGQPASSKLLSHLLPVKILEELYYMV